MITSTDLNVKQLIRGLQANEEKEFKVAFLAPSVIL